MFVDEDGASGWTHAKRVTFEEAFRTFLNHVTINSKDTGPTILGEHLFDAQERFIKFVFDGLEQNIHDFYVLKSRQLGSSTLTRAFSVFWLGMHPGLTGGIVFDTDSNKLSARREIENMIRDLPAEMGFPKIATANRNGITLSNQSTILFMSAGVKKSRGSGTLGRSLGLSYSHGSEMCSWDNSEGLIAYRKSLSAVHPNRLYVWESTARGYNDWYHMWVEAKADIGQKACIFLGWWSKPNQRIKKTSPDFARYGVQLPTPKEAEKIRQVREQYSHQITPEQLAWIRKDSDPLAKVLEGENSVEYEASSYQLAEQPWCVTGEMRVGTDWGLIPIREIPAGRNTTLGIAIHAGPTGRAVIWRAITKSGYLIRGTANHPLISRDGEEVRLDQSLGQTIKLQPSSLSVGGIYRYHWSEGPVESYIDITPDLARLIGLFMGDGSLWGNPRSGWMVQITCCNEDPDIIDECERLFASIFGATTFRHKNGTNGGATDVRVSSRAVFEVFKRLGLSRTDIGKTMRRIHVPEFIWRSPRHIVAQFLAGLFEADGFASREGYGAKIFSKYPDFIREIQLLLLAFGITSRSRSEKKFAGVDRHPYTGNSLSLRTVEATKFHDEIGFLSARKRARHPRLVRKPRTSKRGSDPKEIIMLDEIVSVVNEGVIEDVYNLTIEPDHLYEANGILTHNTEEDAFQQSGSTFFAPESLKTLTDEQAKNPKSYWAFATFAEFIDTSVHQVTNPRIAHLKVWDEPVDNDAYYVVAADPAWGMREKSDRSALQVLRCYADGCDQVAEYAWPLVGTRQFAWSILAVAAWYAGQSNDVRLIVELNGPGRPVWDEINSVKRHIASGYQPKEVDALGLKRIFGNVRNYLFTRNDSIDQSKAWQWTTAKGEGPSSKVRLMERMRDATSTQKVRIRSIELINEMKGVQRGEDNSIEALGASKDDRVLAMALALMCWDERLVPALSSRKRTRESEENRRKLTIQDMYSLYTERQFNDVLRRKTLDRKATMRQMKLAARLYGNRR